MVTNLASLGHCDSVKHLMLWHERPTTCPVSAGGVHDDVLRIASSTSAPGLGRVKTLGRDNGRFEPRQLRGFRAANSPD
jgi:hypothetical protein